MSEKAMAPHSSTLAWKIPWTEEPGGLQSMGSLRVGLHWVTSLSLFTFTFHFHALKKEMASHSSVLAWRIPGMVEPGGLPSMGSHRVGHDWSDLSSSSSRHLRENILSKKNYCWGHYLANWYFCFKGKCFQQLAGQILIFKKKQLITNKYVTTSAANLCL